ncbi:unnamed protein product [Oncorhynchus mykiss]|uniref:Sleeping Beauty transposase HTH domain-containing protein n=1 Tax=Oncorhynchus mykiss TaxID=8022 RepID=A0A060VSL3_ONCMY|nr:unnamed protein product [Oncorhynchus mykiss]
MVHWLQHWALETWQCGALLLLVLSVMSLQAQHYTMHHFLDSVPVDLFQGLPSLSASLLGIMGKSKEISQDPRKKIVDLHKSGSSFGAISKCLKMLEETGTNISISTVKRVLYRHNLKARLARKKPLLQNCHKTARRFATAHGDKDRTFLRNVLWSDETKK